MKAARQVSGVQPWLDVSAEKLRKVGGVRLSVGHALGAEVWKGRSREVGLGDTERARHRVLARNA